MKHRVAILISVLLLLAMAGCGPAEQDESGANDAAAVPAAGPAAPAEPASTVYPCIDGDPTTGQRQYVVFCASCHGERGAGDGPAAAVLDPKPARHTDGIYMNTLSNEHLFKVIKEGGGAVGKSPLMAPWGGSLSDDQIQDLVAFVRSLSEPPYACP